MKAKDEAGFRKTAAVAIASLAIALLFGPALAAAEKENDSAAAVETPGLGWVSPLMQAAAQEKAKAGTAPTAPTWHVFAMAGVSGYDLDGKLPGKFQQYREVPRGFYLGALDLDYLNKDSPWLISLDATEVRERDQRIVAEAWRVGKFRTRIYWDEIPNFISNSPTLFQNTALRFLTVTPSILMIFEILF